MLMLLAAAQVHRLVVEIFDMQPDGVFIKLAAGIQIDHVEHDMAAPDDIEWRIEDMLRDGHGCPQLDFVIPGWSRGPDLRCAIAHRGISRLRGRTEPVIGRRRAPTCWRAPE